MDSQVEQTELKPCPFCGGEAKVVGTASTTVECQNDQCIIGDTAPFNDFSHRYDAIAAWNTRASLALPKVESETWPDTLDGDLRNILGMMCFEFISLSRVYRAAGYEIPKHAEDEQAFFLHKFLGFWFEHGAEWRRAAGEELKEVRAKAAALATLNTGGTHE
jgi:hypothetical protein